MPTPAVAPTTPRYPLDERLVERVLRGLSEVVQAGYGEVKVVVCNHLVTFVHVTRSVKS
jgi:hypothetical protein